ncbi:MAG: YihY family inner membrane protein [Chloroflexi bacterium]|nr:YihY family inner membrane protein [Chloroflexota bacterium]
MSTRGEGVVKKVRGLIKTVTSWPPVRFFQKYGNDQTGFLASGIAYQALFSMLPILLIILTAVSIVLADQSVRQKFIQSLHAILPAQISDSVMSLLNATTSNLSLLGVISAVGLVWSGVSLFGSIEYAFSRMYKVRQRDIIYATLLNFAMMIFFIIFALLSIAASSITTFLTQVSVQALPFQVPELGLLQNLAGWSVSFFSGFLLFFVVYWVIPNVALTPRQVWPGALAATLLFFIIIQIFPFYTSHFATFNQYGALIGLFLVIMTWFYLLAQALLLGAELNSFLFPSSISEQRSRFLPLLDTDNGEREKAEPEATERRPEGPSGQETHGNREPPRESVVHDNREEIRMDDIRNASMADLVNRLLDNISSLIERQIELARVEAKEDLYAGIRAGSILIGGAVILFLALISLIVACILALALVIPGWLSAIIFGVAFGIIGTILALWGIRKIEIKPMEHTRESIQEDVEWAKHLLTSRAK